MFCFHHLLHKKMFWCKIISMLRYFHVVKTIANIYLVYKNQEQWFFNGRFVYWIILTFQLIEFVFRSILELHSSPFKITPELLITSSIISTFVLNIFFDFHYSIGWNLNIPFCLYSLLLMVNAEHKGRNMFFIQIQFVLFL